MIHTSELKTRDCKLREVENRVTLPVNSNVKVFTTSNDVIHRWAAPFLGLKVGSLPGRLNQTAFIARRPGLFMGARSEICGSEHIFMSTPIKAVYINLFSNTIGRKDFHVITPWQI